MQATPDLDWRLNAFRPDLADQRLRGRVEAKAYAVGIPARISVPAAPLVRHPSADAPMDSQLLHGEPVLVFDRGDGWAWVQSQVDHYVGYVESEALAEYIPEPTHRVVVGQTIVLSDAKQIAAPLGTLSLGALVTVNQEGDRFHMLVTGGYVFAAHIAPLDHLETDWVAVAERLVGLPYLWGGRGHGGIDCSGLVQLSLAACGIQSKRDSDQQAESLGAHVSIEPSTWRYGDLIFVPGHVLIVRDRQTVIHATGWQWSTIIEERNTAVARLAAQNRPITVVRRP
jgi:cell wall-associated NlpC family hydrolase